MQRAADPFRVLYEARARADTQMSSSRANRAPAAMLALGLLGLAVAFYDSYVIYHGQPLWCPPPIDGCNEVAASPYARILDLPVGYFGVVYYLYMFALAALLAFDPRSPAQREPRVGIFHRGSSKRGRCHH